MANETIQTLIAIEMVDPERKLNRSEGALYLALSALILAVISIGNLLFARWQIPRYLVHLPLYAIIAVVCLYIYRRHYISFRYTLTDQTFAVEQITGNKERALAAFILTDIVSIAVFDRAVKTKTTIQNVSVQPKQGYILVCARSDEEETALLISPSEDFLCKLTAQWETVVREERV